MSLKAFHILFVLASLLLCMGFGVWSMREHRQVDESVYLAMGVASFAIALALVWYFKWFLRKLKNFSYI